VIIPFSLIILYTLFLKSESIFGGSTLRGSAPTTPPFGQADAGQSISEMYYKYMYYKYMYTGSACPKGGVVGAEPLRVEPPKIEILFILIKEL
jgi:hypothetical protein